mgnify:CR=1 FL=1
MVPGEVANLINRGILDNKEFRHRCARATGLAIGIPVGGMRNANQYQPALRKAGYVRFPASAVTPQAGDIVQYIHYGTNKSSMGWKYGHMGFYGLIDGKEYVISNSVLPYRQPDYIWRKVGGNVSIVEGTGAARRPQPQITTIRVGGKPQAVSSLKGPKPPSKPQSSSQQGRQIKYLIVGGKRVPVR